MSKKAEILKEINYWVELADINEASYTNLINDHNQRICEQFRKSKDTYKNMLQECINDFTEVLNKLDKPQDISNVAKKKHR
jgi:hypothetical protein